jgi:hypothetical protein
MRTSVSKYKMGLPRFGSGGKTHSSECTVRRLTDEERERLDKLLGPPKQRLPRRPKLESLTKPYAPQFVEEDAIDLPDTVYVAQFETRKAQVYHVY